MAERSTNEDRILQEGTFIRRVAHVLAGSAGALVVAADTVPSGAAMQKQIAEHNVAVAIARGVGNEARRVAQLIIGDPNFLITDATPADGSTFTDGTIKQAIIDELKLLSAVLRNPLGANEDITLP